MNTKFIIIDWAGNVCFKGREFASFDDADEYLSDVLEGRVAKERPDLIDYDDQFAEAVSEERGEYYIVNQHTRDSNYLDPTDPR